MTWMTENITVLQRACCEFDIVHTESIWTFYSLHNCACRCHRGITRLEKCGPTATLRWTTYLKPSVTSDRLLSSFPITRQHISSSVTCITQWAKQTHHSRMLHSLLPFSLLYNYLFLVHVPLEGKIDYVHVFQWSFKKTCRMSGVLLRGRAALYV